MGSLFLFNWTIFPEITPGLVITILVNFTVSVPILTSKLPVPLPHCRLNLITATLYDNLPKSQTNRLQVIQNSLVRAVVNAPKSCHVTPILKSTLA